MLVIVDYQYLTDTAQEWGKVDRLDWIGLRAGQGIVRAKQGRAWLTINVGSENVLPSSRASKPFDCIY